MNISPDDGLINLGHSIMASVCLEMYSDLCKAIDSSWKKNERRILSAGQRAITLWSILVIACGSGSTLSTSISFSVEGTIAEWQSKLHLIDCSRKAHFFSYKGTEQSKQGVTKWKPYSRMWSQTALIMYVILIYWAGSRSMQDLKQAS